MDLIKNIFKFFQTLLYMFWMLSIACLLMTFYSFITIAGFLVFLNLELACGLHGISLLIVTYSTIDIDRTLRRQIWLLRTLVWIGLLINESFFHYRVKPIETGIPLLSIISSIQSIDDVGYDVLPIFAYIDFIVLIYHIYSHYEKLQTRRRLNNSYTSIDYFLLYVDIALTVVLLIEAFQFKMYNLSGLAISSITTTLLSVINSVCL